MSETAVVEIILGLLTILFTVIGFLLQDKDAKQESLIEKLFTMHDNDVEKLRQLEITVAANHPERGELERRFDKLDATFVAGVATINSKIDKMLDNATISANAAVAAASAATQAATAATATAQAAAGIQRRDSHDN